MSSKITVFSANCCGLNNLIKRKRVLSSLVKLRPNILFLQETHLNDKSFAFLKAPWFAQYFHSPGSSRLHGTAVLISKTTNFVLQTAEVDSSGRYVFLNGDLDGKAVTLASIYVPNSAQVDYIDQTLAKLDQFKTGSIILGGDLNIIANERLDRQPGKGYYKESSLPTSKLQLLFEKYDLTDIWRQQHPADRNYTYFSAEHQVYTRIDYILLSRSLIPNSLDTDIGSPLWSDHAWTSCSLSFSAINHTRQRDWCLNCSFLFNETVQKQIADDIQNFFKDNADCGFPTHITWGALKAVLRGRFISIATHHKRTKESYRNSLLSKIQELETIHKKTCSKKIYKQLRKERLALETLELSAVQRKLYFLKQRTWTKSPRSLRYLAWRLKKQTHDRAVLALSTPKGHTTSDPVAILNLFADFYSKLYNTESPQQPSILAYLKRPGLLQV